MSFFFLSFLSIILNSDFHTLGVFKSTADITLFNALVAQFWPVGVPLCPSVSFRQDLCSLR